MANGNPPTGTGWGDPLAPPQAPDAIPQPPTAPVAPAGTDWGTPVGMVPVGQPPPNLGAWDDAINLLKLSPRALEANPVDMGANLANITTSEILRRLGYQPNPIPPVVGTIEDAMGVPQPMTRTQAAYVGALALPVGGMWLGGIPGTGLKFANALRQIPAQAAVGGATSAAGYGRDPATQLAINVAGGRIAGSVIPGMASGSDLEAQILRNAALKGGIDIPTAAVAPNPAKALYDYSGVTGTGAATENARVFGQWMDKNARDMGADYSIDGRLTGDVFAKSNATINGLYNEVKAGTPAVPMQSGTQFSNDVTALHAQMMRNPPASAAVPNLIDDLLDAGYQNKTNPNAIPGRTAVEMLQGGSKLDQILRSPADNVELGYAKQLKTILDNATTAVQPQDIQAKWTRADEFYKNQQTFRDATDTATGVMTPKSLGNAVDDHADFLGQDGGTPGLNARIGLKFNLAPGGGAGWRDLGHAVGPGGGALTAYELLHSGLDPKALAAAGVTGWGASMAVNPLMRAVSGGPNPPQINMPYYVRALLNPGASVLPGQQAQQQGPPGQ